MDLDYNADGRRDLKFFVVQTCSAVFRANVGDTCL